MQIDFNTGSQIPSKLMGGIFLLIGIGTLIGGLYWFSVTRTFVAKASQAEGTVTSIEYRRSSSSSSSGGTYYPTVTFTTSSGQEITYKSNSGSNPSSYCKNEKVTVYYDPNNPSSAKLSGFMDLWFGPLLVTFFGVIFSLVGGSSVLFSGNQTNRYQ